MDPIIPNWSIVVTVCHMIAVPAANGIHGPEVQIRDCHREIAFKHRTRTEACNMAQMGIAQWKISGKYADDSYEIGGYVCAPDTEAEQQIKDKL